MSQIKDHWHGYSSPIPPAEFARMRDERKSLPHIRVTRQNLVEKLLANGWSPHKAIPHASIAEEIGVYTRVGDEMVAVMTAKQLFAQ